VLFQNRERCSLVCSIMTVLKNQGFKVNSNMLKFIKDKIAEIFYSFWNARFPSIDNLMTLVNEVGWFTSYLNKPLQYRSDLLITTQDYTIWKNNRYMFSDRKHKKRKQISLTVPTTNRDRMKTKRAPFAFFIHQMDAYIACRVVLFCILRGSSGFHVPIYKVHDNLITTAMDAVDMPRYYYESYYDLIDPLFIVNRFIYQNLIRYTN
jgi:hypothetical protein